MEKDAPCIIHCTGRREKLFDSVGILFCESNFLLSNLVHVFATMS